MSRVLVKPGVEFAVIAPAGYMILDALKAAASRLDKDLTITSGTDGFHSGPLDPHKTGEAYDVRSHDFPAALRPLVVEAIKDGLDPLHFFAFLESPGAEGEHIHIQRRKGTSFSVADLLNA